MTNRFIYGRAWNDKRLVMGGVIAEAEARRRYAEGGEDDWFGVAAYADGVPDDGVPEYTLEVLPKGTFISTSFYDQLYRMRHKFMSGVREGGMLFLEDITDWTYPDDGKYVPRDECLVMTNYRYEVDGTMHWYRSDKVANLIEEADYRDMDISTHWEPVPAFGDWASIARFDREHPA
jgi:hypothetical protein